MDGRPYYERERWQKGRHVHTTLSPRWNVCVYRGRGRRRSGGMKGIRENEGENTWLVVRALRTLLTFFLYSSFSFFPSVIPPRADWLFLMQSKKKSKAYIAAFSSSLTLPPTSGGLDQKFITPWLYQGYAHVRQTADGQEHTHTTYKPGLTE
jgi:hypothetical protein